MWLCYYFDFILSYRIICRFSCPFKIIYVKIHIHASLYFNSSVAFNLFVRLKFVSLLYQKIYYHFLFILCQKMHMSSCFQ